MNPRYAEALWCPICDVPSKECTLPEDEYWGNSAEGMHFYGHAGQWITLAERKQDEAMENYQANRSALERTEALGANAD